MRQNEAKERWRGRSWTLPAVVLVGLAAGYLASLPFAVEVREKELSGLEWSADAPMASTPSGLDGLPLRLIDAGGVGIPPDTAAWGSSYSHATHAFDRLMLDRAPWLDPEHAERVKRDWRAYVRRMSELGANAVVLDAFLELVNFDSVGSGREVYGEEDPLRYRHRTLREFFRSLARDARAVGMDTYLKTDLPAVTPQLRSHLDRAAGSGDTGDPGFWTTYAEGFDEVFRTMPEVAGVVVRVGEAGPLFNVDGLAYGSYMGVRTPRQLQVMLESLLPVFEARDRTMIFRSWSVGLGPLGDLHNDPDAYDDALDAVTSPALVVSTKFVRGDYFGFLPLNPTLLQGRHRRIVEFQARREFEGFGALPNYLAKPHGEALRQITRANPHLEGISLWAQEGGPLRAGPLSLYDVVGFWRWTDANVHATLALARDPGTSERELARAWARRTFSSDSKALDSHTTDALAEVLLTSREAMEKAWYIRPYARRQVTIAGIEVPPILWIFEWDVIGGWSSVLSTLYRTVSGDLEAAIAEGYEAVALTESMAKTLSGLAEPLGAHPDYLPMVRSLAYQESAFRTLAEFRAAFLGYYRWLDTGKGADAWRADAHRFLAAAEDHRARFQTDLDFPALDFDHAQAFMHRALERRTTTWAARAGLTSLLLVLLVSAARTRRATGTVARAMSALWLGMTGPHRLAELYPGTWWLGPVIGLAASSGTAFLVLAGEPGALFGTLALGTAFATGLTLGITPSWGEVTSQGRVVAGLTPLALLAPLPLLVLAVRGRDYLWYLFWSSDGFRAALLGVGAAVVLVTLLSCYRVAARMTTRRDRAATGTALATGFGLILLTALLPDLEGTLSALDDPLGIFPMTHAIINAVTHYGDTPDWVLWAPAAVGAVLVTTSVLVRWRTPVRR